MVVQIGFRILEPRVVISERSQVCVLSIMAYATIAMCGAKPRSKRKVIRLRAGEVAEEHYKKLVGMPT